MSRERVTVAVHAPDRAFAPGVQTALMKLGYNLISVRTARRARGATLLRPRVRIVDDRRLDGLAEHDEELPTILLVGAAAPERSCPQLLGRVRRRGRLADLYPLLQRHLEPCPRTVPRVVDALPARATAGHESWAGAITSISEGGCLFRSSAPLGNGGRLQVCFPLSRHGLVQLPARPSYESPEGYGLVFDPVSPETREALADYVHGRLGA